MLIQKLTVVSSHLPPYIHITRTWLLIRCSRNSERALLSSFDSFPEKVSRFLVLNNSIIEHQFNPCIIFSSIIRTRRLVIMNADKVKINRNIAKTTPGNVTSWSVSTVEMKLSQTVEWNYIRVGVNWAN